MKSILQFLSELRDNNNREWFAANKSRYLEIKDRVEQMTMRLLHGVSQFDPEAARLRPSDCLYRIYRDTRFSADKTPYKTHIGIYINPPYGKKSPGAGYYLHIEPGDCLVAGGAWYPEADKLRAIRQDIYDNIDEYLEILSDPMFSKYYKSVGEDLLKTAPKGFPKDWEYIALLRPRSFTAYAPLADKTLLAPDFEKQVLDRMRALVPLNRFLNYTLLPDRD